MGESTELGQRIRDIRKRMGISSSELARRAGMSQAQISRLETGRHGFRLKTLRKIARSLELRPDYFIRVGEEAELEIPTQLLRGHLRQAARWTAFLRTADILAALFLTNQNAFIAVRRILEELAKCPV